MRAERPGHVGSSGHRKELRVSFISSILGLGRPWREKIPPTFYEDCLGSSVETGRGKNASTRRGCYEEETNW